MGAVDPLVASTTYLELLQEQERVGKLIYHDYVRTEALVRAVKHKDEKVLKEIKKIFCEFSAVTAQLHDKREDFFKPGRCGLSRRGVITLLRWSNRTMMISSLALVALSVGLDCQAVTLWSQLGSVAAASLANACVHSTSSLEAASEEAEKKIAYLLHCDRQRLSGVLSLHHFLEIFSKLTQTDCLNNHPLVDLSYQEIRQLGIDAIIALYKIPPYLLEEYMQCYFVQARRDWVITIKAMAGLKKADIKREIRSHLDTKALKKVINPVQSDNFDSLTQSQLNQEFRQLLRELYQCKQKFSDKAAEEEFSRLFDRLQRVFEITQKRKRLTFCGVPISSITQRTALINTIDVFGSLLYNGCQTAAFLSSCTYTLIPSQVGGPIAIGTGIGSLIFGGFGEVCNRRKEKEYYEQAEGLHVSESELEPIDQFDFFIHAVMNYRQAILKNDVEVLEGLLTRCLTLIKGINPRLLETIFNDNQINVKRKLADWLMEDYEQATGKQYAEKGYVDLLCDEIRLQTERVSNHFSFIIPKSSKGKDEAQPPLSAMHPSSSDSALESSFKTLADVDPSVHLAPMADPDSGYESDGSGWSEGGLDVPVDELV